MRAALAAALPLLLALALPVSADAIRCSQWTRMNPAQKQQALQGLIDDLQRNNRVRQTGVDRGSLTRCLEGYAPRIRDEFDDACAEGIRTDMRALDRIFKTWAWSCVG